jgi:hypothetical protein
MKLEPNQFFDINQLPVEEGLLFFGVSMNRISNRQSAENCFKDLQFIDTKIKKTKGIGMVMWYGDYLYFHSEEKAHILRDRYKHLMLSHKNSFSNILENKPEWTIKAFSFMSFGQVMLDNSSIFQNAFQQILEVYKTDQKFKECVHFDCTKIKVDFDERNILFILEELTAFYLASKGQLNFNNKFISGTEKWILQGYPGKPLKSEVYLFQLNPLKLSNPKNKFENSYYDLESKILYDYDRLDIDTFDFSE